MPQGCLERSPGKVKDAPRMPQGCPERSPGKVKDAPRMSKEADVRPRMPQGCPKDASKEAQQEIGFSIASAYTVGFLISSAPKQ